MDCIPTKVMNSANRKTKKDTFKPDKSVSNINISKIREYDFSFIFVFCAYFLYRCLKLTP